TPEVACIQHIVPSRAAGQRSHADLFYRIEFGHGTAPYITLRAAPVNAADIDALVNPGNAADTTGRAATLDDFTILAVTGGYLGKSDFLTFINNAERGVKQPGLFEGRGPLAILLIVFLGGLALNLTP